MPRKKIIQLIAIIFLVLAITLLIPNTEWTKDSSFFGFISLVLGTSGSIISIFIPTSFTYYFDINDWKYNEVDNDYSLIIQSKKHGQGKSVQIQTFKKNSPDYEEIDVFSKQDQKGNITIIVNSKINGKVVVT